MKNYPFFLAAGFLLLVIGCASPKVYYSPDAKTIVSAHKIIAIVPPRVTITGRKNDNVEALRKQEIIESVNFQKEMYSWLLRRKMQGKMFIEIQDVETTNAKLEKAGMLNDKSITPAEMSEILGVDAVITSNYALSKPMSEGAAVALGVLVGVWGATNETTVTLDIHDEKTKKMIWNYNHSLSGSTFSTPAQLVDALMRNASKKMPYITS
jgi:hypothetical protein